MYPLCKHSIAFVIKPTTSAWTTVQCSLKDIQSYIFEPTKYIHIPALFTFLAPVYQHRSAGDSFLYRTVQITFVSLLTLYVYSNLYTGLILSCCIEIVEKHWCSHATAKPCFILPNCLCQIAALNSFYAEFRALS